jgi:hypothetical protein
MSRSVFVSYVYEDRAWVDQVKSWNSQGLLGSGLTITSERADLRIHGKPAIDAELNAMISGTAVVLVLVGKDTHNRPWIDREIELAVSKHKRIVVARIPSTLGAAPSAVRYQSIIALDPTALRSAL